MIRGAKNLLLVGALVVVGLGLRWMTGGTLAAMNSQDLDSLTVLAVGAVAWVAYGWLVLAAVATALEQLPGAIGAAAGVLATRITSATSRALLRSALGVAAVTPLTVGVAHANSPHTWSAPATSVGIEGGGSDFRATEPRSTVQLGAPRNGVRAGAGVPQARLAGAPSPASSRITVPDRPGTGAPTRYTDLRSGRGVNLPARVTVQAGDTLWDLAAHELGPRATNEQIAVRWPQWYAANRQVIGADPNLILPGQVLRVPRTHQEQ
ncbi:LysM peptidoglycan-binding domain-containing protein [Kribbella sp. NBC_01505]|uniref:LysM peptidoglycan-binding domain-containing protein n=1 Tax=Kribbella sp. NBC_01505 TaxID=2903580 RepID=UPI0038640564